MQSIRDIEAYLHEHIPLSRSMGVSVQAADANGVILSAPLAPNINHRETVFGGSASSIAILAAWSVVHFGLRREGLDSRVVIRKNTMTYDRPMAGTFTATCSAPNTAAWQRFIATLKRRKIARIKLVTVLEYEGEITGRLEGEFVAIRTA